jgi:Excalibur calcium-binding domain
MGRVRAGSVRGWLICSTSRQSRQAGVSVLWLHSISRTYSYMHQPTRSRRNLAAVGLATIALLRIGAVIGTTASADAITRRYLANRDALHKMWHSGVARGPKAAAKQVREGNHKPAYGPKARKVYWRTYTRLDRDRDGSPCEA